MDRLGPLGAYEKRGDATVDLARSIEPGRATTESANHLRIPDLRNDQAEETSRLQQRGFRRRSVPRHVRNDRFGCVDHTPTELRPRQTPAVRFGLWVIRALLTRNVIWRESSPSDEFAELDRCEGFTPWFYQPQLESFNCAVQIKGAQDATEFINSNENRTYNLFDGTLNCSSRTGKHLCTYVPSISRQPGKGRGSIRDHTHRLKAL
jgi:hypothetical protein